MADKQDAVKAKQPKDTKSVTILAASKTGFAATNATEVAEWIKVGENTYRSTGRTIKLKPTHTLTDLLATDSKPSAGHSNPQPPAPHKEV